MGSCLRAFFTASTSVTPAGSLSSIPPLEGRRLRSKITFSRMQCGGSTPLCASNVDGFTAGIPVADPCLNNGSSELFHIW
jgi:hypothetical protein